MSMAYLDGRVLFKLRNLLQFMWNRTTKSGPQCSPYIHDIRQLQCDGFYKVYVGQTELPECLFTGDVSMALPATKKQNTWSITHGGGQRGWIPWNYRLLFHPCNGYPPIKSSGEVFEELCISLKDTYGKCAVVVNTQSWRSQIHSCNSGSSGTFYHLPSGPIELTPMVCCPAVARMYGHELLQLPFQCAHLSPLNSAWSVVKWFATNNRGKYTEAIYDRDTLHKVIYWTELIEGALKKMTKRKWDTVNSRVCRSENYYLKDKW
ncbi:uncharacterized protein C21orf140 homolog [Aplochiton taeniatus]